MKIALITPDWPRTTGGGVAAITATLADGLHAAGQEVQVWTRGGGPRDVALEAERRPYPVRGLPGRSWRRRGVAHWRRGLPDLLEDFAPDALVLATWEPLRAGPACFGGRSVHVFAHGRDLTADLEPPRERARALVLAGGHRWWCLTGWMQGELERRGVPSSSIARLPAAVPSPITSTSPPPARTRGNILAVGRLVPRKGQDVLIAALSHLPAWVQLDVVGEGPDRDRLLALAREGGVDHRVTLRGHVPAAALEDLWARAACFALPVRDEAAGDTEGFGLVFLEAAARGVAAVGGRSSGAAEAVLQDRTGLLVDDPRSPQAVAAALLCLLDHPERAAALGAEGRSLYEATGRPEHLAAAALADLRRTAP